MSFRDKIVRYCEDILRLDCDACVFEEACDKISGARVPNRFTDDEIVLMHEYIYDSRQKINTLIAETASIMAEISADKSKGGQHEQENDS